MFAVRVSNELFDRIDAEFYNPAALNVLRKIHRLSNVVTLGETIAEGYRVVYHGTDSISGLSDEKLLPFLSPTHIDAQGQIDFYAVDKLPLYYKDDYPKGLAKAGELLIEVKGNVNKVGIVPANHPSNLMVSGSLYKASLKDGFDSHYVLAYLKSPSGQVLKNRLTSNTIINYIAKDALYSIPLLALKQSAQKYIGDKVRQAERLRAWAKSLEDQFTSALIEVVPDAFLDKASGKKHATASASDISYTLNPGAFDEERLRVQRYLRAENGELFSELATISTPTAKEYSLLTEYIGLDAIASNSCQIFPSTISEAEVTGTCRYLVEGPVIAKLRPYLNKVSYIPNRLAGAVGSTELMCVSPKGNVSGWYLYGILKSELVLKQLRPVATGATHPRIDQYDVYNLVVPVLENQGSLGELLRQAQDAYHLAVKLTECAKALVEALIEGYLTEEQLIAAEQCPESDRELLASFTTEGFGAEGKPLFDDPYQLYDLLNQVEASDESTLLANVSM